VTTRFITNGPAAGGQVTTGRQCRQRGVLPEEQAVVSEVPAWERSMIIAWALRTGRIDQHRGDRLLEAKE
jgi:hypothetical protein